MQITLSTPIAYSLDYQMSEWLDSKTIANHAEKWNY